MEPAHDLSGVIAPVAVIPIPAAFAAIARSRPDALAVFDRDRRWTYRELDARAAQIAAQLAARGAAHGAIVGLAVDRSLECVAAMLAIWRLGAAIAPIDPAWPPARRAAFGDLGLVVDAQLAASTAGIVPAPAIDASGLALVLATSGSTGGLKLVRISHRALAHRLHALALALPFSSDDVCLHRTPPTFIDAYSELFGPLVHGVPSCVAPHPLAIADLAAALRAHDVTRLLVVPSLLALLLDARADLAGLRLVMTSGEALPDELVARVHAAAPAARLVNIYGSTEVAGDATLGDVHGPVTIGRPLAGVEVKIVDIAGAPAVEGELLVAGPVLADGYDDAALTAARFVRDPAGKRWFRTGDRARRVGDELVLAGRIDDQIKLFGVRIALGEIEHALRAHPGVRAALAAHDPAADRLVAAIVADPGIDIAAVRATAAARLPAVAVPAQIVAVDELPTNAHGKRDRTAVRELASWSGELEELGTDSLARLQLLVRLEAAGWHLEHTDLPEPLTPASLAAVLRDHPRAQPMAPDSPPARFAPTDFQRIMVLESLANARTALWTDQLAYTITGALDLDRLAAAWREVVATEPALRSTFDLDTLDQIVAPETDAALERIDLRTLPAETYLLRVRAEEWRRISTTFRLHRAPLHALAVLAGPDARHDLIFTYHHAILDGESARHVLRMLLAVYAGSPPAVREPFAHARARPAPTPIARAGRAELADLAPASSPAPPAATGFGDTSWRVFHRLVAIRRWLAERRVARHAAREPLRSQLDEAGLAPPVFAGGDVTAQPLGAAFAAGLDAFARERGATPVAVWATALALHLARERGCDDVVFGVVLGARDGRSAETIGMLASCLPLRVRIDPAEPLSALLYRVAQRLAWLARRAGTPLLELARQTGLDPRAVLDTQLVSWGFRDAAWAAPAGIAVTSGRGLTMTAPALALVVSPGELAVGAHAFHRTDRARRSLLALVDAMIAAPDRTAGALIASPAIEAGIAIAVPGL